MSDKSGIEWTDATWNPVVGCKRVSPGCDNCYAIRDGVRLQHLPAYEGTIADGDWTGVVRCLPERLDQPSRWKRPRRIFVNSMSDLFHPAVPDEFIEQVFEVMAYAKQHTFQILTKRPQRMSNLLGHWEDRGWLFGENAPGVGVTRPLAGAGFGYTLPLRNVWLGVSIESDAYAWRANYLRETPAAVRFLSLEPLLGPLPSLDLSGIDWVIVGGESGPSARPMDPNWARDIRDRCPLCVEAQVPFFFKQWAAWVPLRELPLCTVRLPNPRSDNARIIGDPTPTYMCRVGRRTGAVDTHRLDGRAWDEMPTRSGTGSQ